MRAAKMASAVGCSALLLSALAAASGRVEGKVPGRDAAGDRARRPGEDLLGTVVPAVGRQPGVAPAWTPEVAGPGGPPDDSPDGARGDEQRRRQRDADRRSDGEREPPGRPRGRLQRRHPRERRSSHARACPRRARRRSRSAHHARAGRRCEAPARHRQQRARGRAQSGAEPAGATNGKARKASDETIVAASTRRWPSSPWRRHWRSGRRAFWGLALRHRPPRQERNRRLTNRAAGFSGRFWRPRDGRHGPARAR